MNRIEKCKLAIEKGFKYNPETGHITNRFGKVLTSKSSYGYGVIALILNHKIYQLRTHIFAWYIMNNEIVDCLDHINGDKFDNRIINLRSVTHQENNFNYTKAKGYHSRKDTNKWISQIGINGKTIYLGLFDTEEEARQAYLNAKEKYHIIE